MKYSFLFVLLFVAWTTMVSAQQYTSMSGLIHVPSAEMDEAGEARIGVHFLNREFTPDEGFDYEGKYHTWNHYLSITPFSWLEIGYTCTLQKAPKGGKESVEPARVGFYQKDRFFSVKVRPLKEGKYYPAVAIGCNDPSRTISDKGGYGRYFMNYYVAMSKHVRLGQHELGGHLAYRHYKVEYNKKWNGVVGGITYRPGFARNLRFIVEYTGDDVNLGFDWKLWKHVLIQSSLQDGKYFSGGVCFCMNLL